MIVYGASFNPANGYGRVTHSICNALSDAGMRVVTEKLDPNGADMAIAPPWVSSTASVRYTMYESTVLPKDLVANLNKSKLVLVPCQQNIEAFKKSGVKAKLRILHLYCTPKYIFPAPAKPFTFIHIGADSGIPERKRSADVVEAFKRAFKSEEDVRLIVKKTPDCKVIQCFDRRVNIIYETLEDKKLHDLMVSAHVGVFPGGQEGWGFPHLDLMATGRPVICPFYGGPKEFVSVINAFYLEYLMTSVPQKHFKGIGQAPRVAVDTLAAQLRYCYENQDEVIQRGIHAYRTALGFTRSRMSAALSTIINENPRLFKV